MGNCLGSDAEGTPPPRNPATGPSKAPEVQLYDLPGQAKTGDLLILKKEGETDYGVILKEKEVSPRTPLLVARAVKNEDGSYGLRVSSVNYTILYQGYTEAFLKRLSKPVEFSYDQAKCLPSNVERKDTAKRLMVQLYASVFGLQLPGEDPEADFPDKLPVQAPQKILWEPFKIGPLAEEGKTFSERVHEWTTADVSDQPHENMKEVVKNLKAGDVVLSAGIGVGGAFIRVADGSLFSHAAIIVDDPYIDEPCIWEAIGNSGEATDLDTGRIIHGVTLIPFSERCKMGWDGPIAVRKLTDISDAKREEIKEKLTFLRCEFQGKAYEEDLGALIQAKVDIGEDLLPFLKGTRGKEAMDTIFCSELVSCSYLVCGLLKPGKPASEYTPKDFSTSTDEPIETRVGTLQSELYVTLPFEKDD